MIVRGDRRTVIGALTRAALLPAGAFAVHQLRYLLAYGGHASAVLAREGHAYLHSLVPWIVLLLAVAAGGFLTGLGRALAGQRSTPRYTLSFLALWLACLACLVAIYVAQEFLEGLAATGHPAGWPGIFGYGGWYALPAAASVGLVLAALLHGARWALDEAARRSRGTIRITAPRPPAPLRPRPLELPRLLPLAGGWSDRGPPAR